MMQRPNRTGIESANGVVLSWREVDWLMDPHEKTTKGSHTDTDTHIDRQTDTHTHTHTHIPRPPPRSDHPWYLWETLLSLLFLGGTNHTKEKSQEQNLHLVSLMVFLLEKLRVSQRLERMRVGATFYRIVTLVWHVMNPWLSLLRSRLQRHDLQYPAWQRSAVLREAQLNLDIWPVDWLRYHNTHLIFQGWDIYFPLNPEIQTVQET